MTLVINLDEIKARYKAEKLEKHESDAVVEAVFKALEPHFGLPVTAENMWMIQKQILVGVQLNTKAVSLGKTWRVIFAALAGGAEMWESLDKEKVLGLWRSDHYLLQENHITDEKAVAAYYRGSATIGELFFLQPSIFIG